MKIKEIGKVTLNKELINKLMKLGYEENE